MSANSNKNPRPVMQTVEEACQLLRECGASTWVWFYAGSAPFVCVFLHFWNDMSRAANAASHLPMASLLVVLTYMWMKVAHAVFSERLMGLLRGEARRLPLPRRALARMAASQIFIHSTAILVLPLALIAAIPFGWAYAFYHNVSALAIAHFREGGSTSGLIQSALKQSHFLPGQNHSLILVIFLTGLLIWLNLALGTMVVSGLMDSFTGSTSQFTRNEFSMFDTGFVVATLMLAYLVTGPFAKAVYAIRCFHGASRRSGLDLFASLAAVGHTSALVAAFSLFWLAGSANATPSQPPFQAPQPVFSPIDPGRSEELDRQIREVMQKDVFQWRMPREKLAEDERGPIATFVDDLVKFAQQTWDETVEKIREFFRKLFGKKNRSLPSGDMGLPALSGSVEALLYILLAILVVVLAMLVWKTWKPRKQSTTQTAAVPEPVNLDNDQVLASQLPENEWLRLAAEKIEAGDFRLALRALFLATLAHLGERRMIAVSRAKANGDYLRELSYRARDRRELRESFTENVRAFDRAWYGWHEVTRDHLERFRRNHDRIASDEPSP